MPRGVEEPATETSPSRRPAPRSRTVGGVGAYDPPMGYSDVSTAASAEQVEPPDRLGLRGLAGPRLLANESDARLVALARAGDQGAFDAIIARYREPLLRYCRGFLPPAAAEDALQQTFINAYSALTREGVRAPIALKPWLYRAAHNAALNVRREPHGGHAALPDELDAVERTDEVAQRNEELARVVGAIQDLPPKQRQVIVRNALGGDSFERIAADLGVRAGAVRQLALRARRTVRRAAAALTPLPVLRWLQLGSSVAESSAAGGGGTATKAAAAIAAVVACSAAVQGGAPEPDAGERAAAPAAVAQAAAPVPDGARSRALNGAVALPAGPAPVTSPAARGESSRSPGPRPRSFRVGDGRSGRGQSGDGGDQGSSEPGSGGGSSSGSGSSGSGSSGSGSSGSGSSGSGSSGSGSSGSGSSGSGSSGSGSSGSGSSGSGSSGSGSSGSGSSDEASLLPAPPTTAAPGPALSGGSGSSGSGSSDSSGSSGSGSSGPG